MGAIHTHGGGLQLGVRVLGMEALMRPATHSMLPATGTILIQRYNTVIRERLVVLIGLTTTTKMQVAALEERS